MPHSILAPSNIKELLTDLSKAIARDQIYVDSLPREQFTSQYDDGMWREWRRKNLLLIERLIKSSDDLSPSLLRRLTVVAAGFDAAIVRTILLETLADIVGGCLAAPPRTAQGFFDGLTNEVVRQARGKHRNPSARKALLEWFDATDPLAIARDPECQYPVSRRQVHSDRTPLRSMR
ncbi:hypothetical protein [Bradyrhizobium sp. CB1015]|uniref:hypothetical protein n=1 Tax=Bradyrhizobium sp. CB1015 TaxID=2976822 RepID=UPI0021AA7B6D|nr:hypothetical protein [Bradyrhizobium sp. CB1015]UWU91375.1 hypothetical protein N2604_33845 [Bradyrhizobium sp. CB1015]